MKLARKVGATSNILQVFIQDSSSTTGAGLTGLAYDTSGLTAYYHRDTDTTATAISLVTMTVGTFTSSGFKEIDSTNMPGWYQFCPPDAALATGAKSVGFHLKGATNMAPLPIEIDLDAQVDVTHVGGTAQTARDLGASVLLSVGTGTGQVNLSSGKVPATLASTDVTGNVAADVQTIKTQIVTCSGGVTVPAATLASTTNITAGTITTVTGAVGSVTGNVGGNVTGSVGSVASGGITAASFAADSITASAIATDAIGSAELAASAVSEISSAVSAAFPDTIGLTSDAFDAITVYTDAASPNRTLNARQAINACLVRLAATSGLSVATSAATVTFAGPAVAAPSGTHGAWSIAVATDGNLTPTYTPPT